MDFIAKGLREAMQGGQQGALAQVTRSGIITVGQRVTLRTSDESIESATTAAV
jgi:hypothetical protein